MQRKILHVQFAKFSNADCQSTLIFGNFAVEEHKLKLSTAIAFCDVTETVIVKFSGSKPPYSNFMVR